MKSMKRISALLLCIMMLSALLPTAVAAAGSKNVTMITITDVTEPAAGEKPNNAFTIASDGIKAAAGSNWYNLTDSKQMNGESFEGGKRYRFNAYVEPVGGYQWPQNYSGMTVKMNGNTAGITVLYGKSYICVRYEFVCAVPITVLSSVDVSVNAPEAGGSTGIATPARADQVSASCFWYEDGKEMELGMPFRKGHVYKVEVHAFANSGYSFDPSAEMKINGSAGSDKTVKSENEIAATYTFPKLEETKKCTLTAKVEGGHGSIFTGYSVTLDAGETTTVIFEPDDGYMLDKVTINGETVGVLSNVLDVMLDEDKLLIATFIKVPEFCSHTITAVDGIREATCTQDGYSGDTVCLECGTMLSQGETIPMIPHTESNWIIDTEAGIGVEGSRHTECTVCHTVISTDTIPALTEGDEPIIISSVDIVYVWKPVAGKTPDNNYGIATDNISSDPYGEWYNLTDNKPMTNEDRFEPEKTYRFSVIVYLGPAFAWPDDLHDVAVTVNGEKAVIETVDKESRQRIYFDFFCPPVGITVSDIAISGVKAPVAGELPDNNFIIETEGVKKVKDGYWYNETDGFELKDTPFEAGKTYRFYTYVDVEDGYSWPNDTNDIVATINGQLSGVGTVGGEVYLTVYTSQFGCEEPGTDDPGTYDPGPNGGPSLWWLWVLIAVVAVGGAAAAFFIVKNNKKKKESKI